MVIKNIWNKIKDPYTYQSEQKGLTEKSKCPKCERKGWLHAKERYGEKIFWCAGCGYYFYPDGTQYTFRYSDMYTCPHCGEITSFVNNEPHVCKNCGYDQMLKTDCTHEEWDSIVSGNPDGWKAIKQHLRERYVLNNEYLDKDLYNSLIEKEYKKYLSWKSQQRDQMQKSTVNSTPQIHCPTCGSTNVKRISAASKVAGAYAFGLFSKTAKSQFKCGNCGYKW